MLRFLRAFCWLQICHNCHSVCLLVDKFQPKAAQLKLVIFKCTVPTESTCISFLEPINICPSYLICHWNNSWAFGFFSEAIIVLWKNTDFWGREGGQYNLSCQLAGPSVCHVPSVWSAGVLWHP